ncbi:hypothetical protein [Lipingzhangella halophila]|nr:hypothetical protein [Lipingzhangella halophila]
MADERADFAQVLSASATDLLAVTADGVPNVSARERSAANRS